MKTGLSDTTPQAEQVLINLIRKSSTAERFARVGSLTQTVVQLSKRAIRRANPDLNAKECDLLFVSYHYGSSIAEKLKKFLERSQNE